MTRIYGLKNCDTCRKALKALGDEGFCDVRADGVPPEVLDRAIARFGDEIVNTRSRTWRELGESDRALPVLALLQAHPTVMKRPLIERGGAFYLGWTPATRAALGVA